MMQRRSFLIGSALVTAGATAVKAAETVELPPDAAAIAQDRNYWAAVRDLYDVDRSIANLENGYWGIMARPVLEAYVENTQRVNRQNSFYARSSFGADFEKSATGSRPRSAHCRKRSH